MDKEDKGFSIGMCVVVSISCAIIIAIFIVIIYIKVTKTDRIDLKNSQTSMFGIS